MWPGPVDQHGGVVGGRRRRPVEDRPDEDRRADLARQVGQGVTGVVVREDVQVGAVLGPQHEVDRLVDPPGLGDVQVEDLAPWPLQERAGRVALHDGDRPGRTAVGDAHRQYPADADDRDPHGRRDDPTPLDGHHQQSRHEGHQRAGGRYPDQPDPALERGVDRRVGQSPPREAAERDRAPHLLARRPHGRRPQRPAGRADGGAQDQRDDREEDGLDGDEGDPRPRVDGVHPPDQRTHEAEPERQPDGQHQPA